MAPSNFKTVDWNKYALLSEDDPHSIVWASSGGDGSGKSHFGLTAPSPIFVCAFDAYGMNRVNKEVKRGKEIRIGRYGFNPAQHKGEKATADAAQVIWDRFVEEYRTALVNARTVLWDREDQMWLLLRHASFGANSSAPKEYGPLNQEYASLVAEAQAAGKNLGVLRGVGEKWVSKFDPAKGKMVAHNTGVMTPDGMKSIPDFVDVTLVHRWDDTVKSFMVKIDKFPNKDFKGDEFPDLDFPSMAQAAYPESAIENWA